MTDVVEFRSKITREEMARLIYFLIFSNPKRWLFFLLTAVSAGCLADILIGYGWLAGLLWFLLWIAISAIAGYFNIFKKIIAVNSWFEETEYSISPVDIKATIPAGTRVFPMAKLRKVRELNGFLILSSRIAEFYISKQRISPAQLAALKGIFGKNVKIGSGRISNRIAHILFKV